MAVTKNARRCSTATNSSCVGAYTRQAIIPAAATIKYGCVRTIQGRGKITRRAKTRTNVSRYNANGNTHNKGTAAMSVEMNMVTPINRLEGTSDSASQCSRPQVGTLGNRFRRVHHDCAAPRRPAVR